MLNDEEKQHLRAEEITRARGTPGSTSLIEVACAFYERCEFRRVFADCLKFGQHFLGLPKRLRQRSLQG